jgi:NADH-quinone oxidoreductase subunit K
VTSAIWGITAILFAAGVAMVVMRRQLLAMLLGVELMIAGANLAIVHSAGLHADAEALAVVALVLAVAAAEAVVGLSLILRAVRAGRGTDAGEFAALKG